MVECLGPGASGALLPSPAQAPMYAFVGGLMGGFSLLATQGFRRVLYWAPGGGLCECLHHMALVEMVLFWLGVFKPYYAKLDGTGKFLPCPGASGWKYLTGYALVSGTGFWFGSTFWDKLGLQHGDARRGGSECRIVGFDAAGTRMDPSGPRLANSVGSNVVHLRIQTIFALIVVLPGVYRSIWMDRAHVGVGVNEHRLIFTLFWMGLDAGYRWLSFSAIPMAVLVADALAHAWMAGRNTLDVAMRVWVIAPITIILHFNGDHGDLCQPVGNPIRCSSPRIVHATRTKTTASRPCILLEVDMGAHMWWSGFELVDMAGLIDVPMGHHKWEKPFIQEYVFHERKPDFAHVHGSWASRTKMRSHKEWKDYLPISPYPTNRRYHHTGNHIRKDLIVRPEWAGPQGREVRFDGGLRMHGWTIHPSPCPVSNCTWS